LRAVKFKHKMTWREAREKVGLVAVVAVAAAAVAAAVAVAVVGV
jgi:hypothetical protein